MGNTMKTALLLGLMSGLLLVIGRTIGGQTGLAIALVMAVVMNFTSYWFSDRIVLRMYRAQEVGAGHPLHAMVDRLSQRAGLPMPRVYVIPDPSPNAFATGRNASHAAVAATEGILRVLDERELEGVIAHELSHVRNHDILIGSVAATVAAAIMSLAHMLQYAAIFGGVRGGDRDEGPGPLGMILTIVLAPMAAMLIQAAISRSREFAADAGAAAIIGSPYGLVDALKKIDAVAQRVPLQANAATAHMFIIKPLSVRGMLGLFSTHPPMEKRIAALLGRH